MNHPLEGLNDIVHQRTRLGVLTILHETARAEFGFIRESLGLTDGNLSGHLRVLEDAGLILIEKGYEGRRPRTWVKITKLGRKAFADEIKALKQLVQRAETTSDSR